MSGLPARAVNQRGELRPERGGADKALISQLLLGDDILIISRMDHGYEWLKLPSEKAAWFLCVWLERVVVTVGACAGRTRPCLQPRWAPLEPWERLLPWYVSIREALCASPFLTDIFPYALERIFVLPSESGWGWT